MFRSAVALLALAALAAPSPAGAAFGEVAPLAVQGVGESDCLRASGAPGEIALQTADGVRFVHASREGLTSGPAVVVGPSFLCGSVVTRPSGAGVVAGESERAVAVAVRDPGGAWTPVRFALEPDWYANDVRAAVSDRGDVLVVWRESGGDPGEGPFRIRAARRPPGGAFGPVETIATHASLELVLPAVAATGEAFVLTTRSADRPPPFRAPVSVATAAPGAPFGAPLTIAQMSWPSVPALVAGADGRVLVGVPDGTSMLVAERPPGGSFGPATVAGGARASGYVAATAALGPNGEAAVAWTRALPTDAQLVTRSAPGAFGAPRTIGRLRVLDGIDPFPLSQTYFALINDGGTILRFAAGLPASMPVTPDGRALFGWFDDGGLAPALVAAPFAGGPLTRLAGGRGLTMPQPAFALTSADGAAGLAWVADEQLHFATEGAGSPAQPALPQVTVGAPRRRVITQTGPLRLPVRCSGPCELRGEIRVGLDTIAGELTLQRAGRGELRIDDADLALSGPRTRVTIRIAYRAPGALATRSRTVAVTLRRSSRAPDMRVRELRAVRRGGTIRVTWRTAGRSLDGAPFYVTGTTERDRAEETGVARLVDGSDDKPTYAVTLRAPASVRWIAVRSEESVVTGRPSFARVR